MRLERRNYLSEKLKLVGILLTINLSYVGDIAVLHHVISNGSSTEVVYQLQEQEAPVQPLHEDVVEAVGEAGQQLAHHSEQQETLPAVLV